MNDYTADSGYNISQIPYSLEAEQSTLGAILINPDLYEDVVNIVSVEDFYLERNKQIYDAITELYLKNKSLDLVTLLEILKKSTKFNESEIKEYLVKISDFVPVMDNIKDYAEIVKEKSLRRKLIGISGQITKMAYEDNSDITFILDRAEQLIFALSQGNITEEFVHIKSVLSKIFDQVQRTIENKDSAKGLATGFSNIDDILIGMNPGDLILIGARPGMGKTAFAMNIAVNTAAKKKTIGVFSLEMSKEQIVSRVLSSEAFVDGYKLRAGNLGNDDWAKIAEAAARISECNIYFDDTPNMTVTQMKAKLRKLQSLDLVIIDYLQLMHTDSDNSNRVQEISEISRNLKIMAKELRVPVITCAQLSRGPEKRDDKRPMLSDLRESGSIEQDADVVMFIYREEYYGGSVDKHNRAEIIFAKNRHGSVGKVDVGWEAKYTRFYNIDKVHENSGSER